MPTGNLPSKPLGVTIHNTEAIDVASATTMAEQYVRATVNGNMNDVRVHFYVDDICAWQMLPLTLQGWHAADGNGNGNTKTIAIEVIGNLEKAEKNAAKLVAYLLNKYGLTTDNLYTHTYWLNVRDGKQGNLYYLNTLNNKEKMCPIYILPHWAKFRDSVAENLKKNDVVAPPSQTTSEIKSSNKKIGEQIDITYQVYTTKWLPSITNCNDTSEDGYAGYNSCEITALAAKASKGQLSYRVHLKNGGWLSWISNYNIKDFYKGFAGLRTDAIDAIQARLSGVDGYNVQYRVAAKRDNYYDWVTGDQDYAGSFGKPIDRIQMKIVKV